MTAAQAVGRRGAGASAGRAILFVLLYLVALASIRSLFMAPAAPTGPVTGETLRVAELVSLAAALLATAIMVSAIDRRPWADVGLGAAAARPSDFAWGWCIGAAPIGVASGLLLLVGWLHVGPAAPGSSLAAALHVSIVLVPAALSEEVICRGYLFTAVRDGGGARVAIGLTSVLFGVLHAANAGSTVESVAIVILAGLFLAAVRVVFDSLYAAWAAHTAWNWVMAVPLHAPVSGVLFEAPDYRTVSAGPAWMTGGAWGPEGGLAAALATIAMLAYLHSRHRRLHARLGREES